MQKPSSLAKWGVAVLLMSSLSSCEDIFEQYFPKPNPTTPSFPSLGLDIPFYTLSGGTRLDAYSTANPSARTSSVAITGLGNGETLLAIDFRPATGQLYGVSSASRLYVINQNTGTARAIGAGAFSPAVAGNLVGFDFNPTVDRIRLVTSTGQNLRLNPETGTVAATDGVLNGAAGATITGAAYTNNTAGASTTVLYDLDPTTDQLYRQDPPNDGTLVAVGALNLNITGDGGFDIDAKTGTALGLYTVNGNPTLFTVDLATGTARPLAQYAANLNYSGLAIPTQPVAYTTYAVENRQNAFLNSLLIFNPSALSTTAQMPITGLSAMSDYVYGIDFRPATGQLYALVGTRTFDPVIARSRASNGRLYTINPATGAATLVAALSVPLNGFSFGFDFNPMADRIRVIGSEGQNLRVNPMDGVAIEDGRVSGATINGAAYDNNMTGAATTNLYVMDTNVDRLLLLSPPNAGTIIPIGPFGVNQGAAGFDIGGTSNKGYAVLSTSARNSFNRIEHLWSIDLTTGAATDLGDFGFPVSGTTVGTTFYSLTGFALGLGF